jgi:hypothetical protein
MASPTTTQLRRAAQANSSPPAAPATRPWTARAVSGFARSCGSTRWRVGSDDGCTALRRPCCRSKSTPTDAAWCETQYFAASTCAPPTSSHRAGARKELSCPANAVCWCLALPAVSLGCRLLRARARVAGVSLRALAFTHQSGALPRSVERSRRTSSRWPQESPPPSRSAPRAAPRGRAAREPWSPAVCSLTGWVAVAGKVAVL